MRLICNDNDTTICRSSLEFYGVARQLLADLTGFKVADALSLYDAAMMLRNWKVIEGSIAYFEWQVVRHIQCTFAHESFLYQNDTWADSEDEMGSV